MKIGACGTYRENRRDCPRTQSNALQKKILEAPPGGSVMTHLYKRESEKAVCCTIYQAFSGSTVKRRVKTLTNPSHVQHLSWSTISTWEVFNRSTDIVLLSISRRHKMVPDIILPLPGHCSHEQLSPSHEALQWEASGTHDPQGLPGGADSPVVWCHSFTTSCQGTQWPLTITIATTQFKRGKPCLYGHIQ